jgi:hypothetical protein
MIKMDSVKHDNDEHEPVFFLAEDVVSVRGGGGEWTGIVSLVKTKHADVPEMAILGSVADVGSRILAAQAEGYLAGAAVKQPPLGRAGRRWEDGKVHCY